MAPFGSSPGPSVAGGYTIQRWNGSSWTNIAGGAVRIAVDPNGRAWVVNNAGNIFRWTGSAWQTLPGLAKDIGIGADGTVWINGASAVTGGYPIYRWFGAGWAKVNGAGVAISVAADGKPWNVSSSGTIYRAP